MSASIAADLEKWRRWLAVIADHAWKLQVDRAIHLEMLTVLQDLAPEHGGLFLARHIQWYKSQQVMALRRMADADSRAISLRRLLADIGRDTRGLTRAWHRELYIPESVGTWESETWAASADATFDKWMDPPPAEPSDDDSVSASVIIHDLRSWKALTKAIDRLANHELAHRNEDPNPGTLTWDELHATIDDLFELLDKYSVLLTGATVMAAKPDDA